MLLLIHYYYYYCYYYYDRYYYYYNTVTTTTATAATTTTTKTSWLAVLRLFEFEVPAIQVVHLWRKHNFMRLHDPSSFINVQAERH